VFDEITQYCSDSRPTANLSWRPIIGVLHLGILSAIGLSVMKTLESHTDAHCVAKYGSRWTRTRTIVDCFDPQWNEQYTSLVYDLSTVITIGVFDNGHLQGGHSTRGELHQRLGKVRIDYPR
jgi:Ca2+-dependent lipid-binding protein